MQPLNKQQYFFPYIRPKFKINIFRGLKRGRPITPINAQFDLNRSSTLFAEISTRPNGTPDAQYDWFAARLRGTP